MQTKEKLLELLESNRGSYFSGETIARTLSLSRTAVWKAVKSLQNDGYAITAVTNKGYCLSEQNDILSAQGIRKYLSSELTGLQITVLSTVSSTNSLLREKAAGGTQDNCVILANEQTAGRGRSGRSFFSPAETGIYMSLLLRPGNCSSEQALQITTMAAAAVCASIDAVSDSEEQAQIKWVNDIYLHGKKVCGILTEGSFSLENGMLEYAVLGLGINIYPPKQKFPAELAALAGSVFQTPRDDVKNRLAAEFLNRFYDYYTRSEASPDYIEEYRKRSLVIGKQVLLVSASESKSAVVLGIDNQCRLLVRYENGREEACSSGEIRVKGVTHEN